MDDRKSNSSFPWLVAGAVAALAAVGTPVSAFEQSARAQGAQAEASERSTMTTLDGQDAGTFTITNEGVSHRYIIDDGKTYRILADGGRRSLTAEERREVARHRRAEAQARAHMRRQEAHMRGQEALVRQQEAHMRDQMALAAGQMANAARQMREEADRLGDPAYRARQIEVKRLRGEIVTDQQLIDSIPGLRQGADQMEHEAARTRVPSR